MLDPTEILATCTGFDWDHGNLTKSSIKHGVEPIECEQIFINEPLVVATDSGHSQSEQRFFALGQSHATRLLFLVFTLRGTLIRIISARPMSRHEREVYHHAQADQAETHPSPPPHSLLRKRSH